MCSFIEVCIECLANSHVVSHKFFVLFFTFSVVGNRCLPYIQPFVQVITSILLVVPLYLLLLWTYARYGTLKGVILHFEEGGVVL